MNPEISVCIPIYNVEKYIAKCLISLFTQTIANKTEFILVNDCTQDASMSVVQETIDKFPILQKQITIISHKQNQGPSAARNTALQHAQGKYIIFVDSDDWTEPDYLQQMYTTAEKTNADIVICDYITETKPKSYCVHNIPDTSPESMIRRLILMTTTKNLWVKLIRRQLYIQNDITFPDNIIKGEDMLISIKLVMCASCIRYVPKPLYHYNKYNEYSICHKKTTIKNVKQNIKQQIYFWTVIENLLLSHNLLIKYIDAINTAKAVDKLDLITESFPPPKELYTLYPEADPYFACIENFAIGRKYTKLQKITIKLLQKKKYKTLRCWLTVKYIRDTLNTMIIEKIKK